MADQKKPLVTHIYTADPSAHVFNGKLYIYPSHDVALDCPDDDNGDQYQMEDYHILSMDSPPFYIRFFKSNKCCSFEVQHLFIN